MVSDRETVKIVLKNKQTGELAEPAAEQESVQPVEPVSTEPTEQQIEEVKAYIRQLLSKKVISN